MSNPILRVTDGDNTVDLLSVPAGLLLNDWTPAVANLKGGGTYSQSVMSDGRQLVMRNYENIIETFNLKVHGESQDTVIEHSQRLFRMLENARTYWYTPFQTKPVWIEARAPNETNLRYALIYNYTMDGLDNPYALPFFKCVDVAMDDVNLVIERGHWQNVQPSTGECVPITGSLASSITSVTESVTAGADDMTAWLGASGHTATSINITQNYVWCGIEFLAPNRRMGFSARFSAVDIPTDATVISATLRLTAAGTSFLPPPVNKQAIIYGDNSDAATAPVDVASWNAKSLTTQSEFVNLPFPHTAGNQYDYDITDIFNEIRDRVGWTDGNAMQFFMEESNVDSGYAVAFASQESTSYTEPQLLIEYSGSAGQPTETCEDQVWAVDKYNTSALTHVYLWDGAAWSANIINDALIDCADTPPAVADKIYFGSQDTGGDGQGPFSNISFDIITGGITVDTRAYVWEYWQGAPTSAWTAFPASDLVDKTQQFYQEGRLSIAFVQPMDTTNGSWVPQDLSVASGDGAPPAVTAWWIRARLSDAGTATDPPQIAGGNSNLYTVTWPNINISQDQIGGDIPATARIKLDDSGNKGTSAQPMNINRVILAVSSVRGPYGDELSYNFSAFLPVPYQFPSVVQDITYGHGDFSSSADVTAPSGASVLLNPAGTGDRAFTILVNSLHFFGSYRAFVRVRQIGGSDNHFKVRLQTLHSSAGAVYSETSERPVTIQSTATLPNWQLLDLGLLDIPTGLPARTADEGANIFINVLTDVVDNTGDLRFMDVILMPTDEWIVDVQDIGSEGFADGYNLHVDSLSVPKVDLRGLAKRGGSPSFANPVPWKIIGAQMRIPANSAAKIWMLAAKWDSVSESWISRAGTTAKIQLFTAERYLGLRGNR